MAISAWVVIPAPLPITLQTLGVFLALLMLGGRLGTLSVAVYILLGAVGLPVFSGFSGGMAALSGPTGGYILGFLIMALIYWALEKSRLPKALILSIGTVLLYAFGTGFFLIFSGAGSVLEVLFFCVLPYIIPDAIKLSVAWIIYKRIPKI